MRERSLISVPFMKVGKASAGSKICLLFIVGYVFLSGFVFVEPSPAEIWFLLSVPFILMRFRTNFQLLISFGMIFIPMLLSASVGYLALGYYNLRFVAIDLYLMFLFLFFASSLNSLKSRITPEDLLKILMGGWTIAGLVNVSAGLISFFAPAKIFASSIRFGVRLTGFFKDPNVLGPFLVPSALYFLRELFRSKEHRILNFLLFVFISLGVFLTFSRAAWANYVVTLSIYFTFTVFNRKTFKRSVVLAVVLLSLLVALFYLSSHIYLFDVNLQDFMFSRLRLQSYDEYRFEAQSRFVDIISSTSILFGTGPGNYEHFTNLAAHSLYARYIGERGLLGFVLFVIFLGMSFRKASKSKLKKFLIPVIIGQLINSFFIDSLHWRHFWILLSLCFM